MTLYTIMPIETVWAGSLKEPEQTADIQINGILMQVMPMANNSAQIVRLLHCSLADYLNPAYAPGQMISYLPYLKNETLD
ncbi:putative HAD superfamily hydrolase [Paenibacillus sp. DS2015]|uniref:YlzJ-like family protein n=1 Tax=Paenibacillus sp. DS2015 TaxID=3373917 RepID=UPI003D1FA880